MFLWVRLKFFFFLRQENMKYENHSEVCFCDDLHKLPAFIHIPKHSSQVNQS